MSEVDGRIVAALALHKPEDWLSLGVLCDACEGSPPRWPCPTAVALGVQKGTPANLEEALAWWRQAGGDPRYCETCGGECRDEADDA